MYCDSVNIVIFYCCDLVVTGIDGVIVTSVGFDLWVYLKGSGSTGLSLSAIVFSMKEAKQNRKYFMRISYS